MVRNAGIAIVLIAATAFVYGQTLAFDFVSLDDPDFVTDNENIRLGLSREGWSYALETPVMGSYHPLTMLSLLADYELHGLEAGGYHASNVLLHALATLLLFGFFAYATRRPWPSAAVALLFCVHPLHVESVAWISERKDVLSTAFGFGSLWAWAGFVRRGSRALYALSLGLLALGLLSKPMLVTFPVLMLLLDRWPLGRLALPGRGEPARAWRDALRPRVVEKLPFFGVALAFAALTLWTQHQAGAMGKEALAKGSLGFSAADLPNVVVSYARYVAMTIWPSDLSVLYPHPNHPHMGGVPLAGWQVAEAILLLALISGGLARLRRPYALVGWLWFLISLLPVIGIIQFGSQALADRYTYLPSVGLFAIASFAAGDLLGRLAGRSGAALPLAAGLAAAALAGYAVTARSAAAVWRDSQSLYEQGLRVNPRNVTLRYNLAVDLRRSGQREAAIEHYRKVLEVNPRHRDAHVNLGDALASKGMHEEAIEQYRAVLAFAPADVKAHNNLGNSLKALGRLDEALDHLRAAVTASAALDEPIAHPHYNLGNLLYKLGRFAEAEAQYRRAIAIDPGYVAAHTNLGNALVEQGRNDEAIALFQRALELAPDDELARTNLEVSLRRQRSQAAGRDRGVEADSRPGS